MAAHYPAYRVIPLSTGTPTNHRYRGKRESIKFTKLIDSSLMDISTLNTHLDNLNAYFNSNPNPLNSYIANIQKYRFRISWRVKDAYS